MVKKGIVITVLSCVALFIIGALLLVIGIANGGKLFFNIDFGNHKVITSNKEVMIEGDETVNEFSGIDVEIADGDLKIVEGDGYKIRYNLYGENRPDIKVEDGVLKFKENHKKSDNYFNFNLTGFEDEFRPFVEITVPEGVVLKDNAISIALGDVEIAGMGLEETSFNVANGDLKLKNVTADSLDIVDAYGQVDISESDIKELDMDIDYGDINCIDLRAGTVKINNAFGDTKLDMAGEEADYSLDVELSVGEFELNGKKVKNKYSQNKDKEKKISVEIASGDLEITFK